jgi:hypothetical protein
MGSAANGHHRAPGMRGDFVRRIPAEMRSTHPASSTANSQNDHRPDAVQLPRGSSQRIPHTRRKHAAGSTSRVLGNGLVEVRDCLGYRELRLLLRCAPIAMTKHVQEN